MTYQPRVTGAVIVVMDTIAEGAGCDPELTKLPEPTRRHVNKQVKHIIDAEAKDRPRLILAINERFWHAPAMRLVPFARCRASERNS